MKYSILYILVLIFFIHGCESKKEEKKSHEVALKIEEISFIKEYENIADENATISTKNQKKALGLSQNSLNKSTKKLEKVLKAIEHEIDDICNIKLKNCIELVKKLPKDIDLYRNDLDEFVLDDISTVPTKIVLKILEDEENYLEVSFDEEKLRYIKYLDFLDKSDAKCAKWYSKKCINLN